MAYGIYKMTLHGFRAIVGTLLDESGIWHLDVIERALAHSDRYHVRAAYYRGTHWAERVKMAQWWSDHVEWCRDDADIIHPQFGRV